MNCILVICCIIFVVTFIAFIALSVAIKQDNERIQSIRKTKKFRGMPEGNVKVRNVIWSRGRKILLRRIFGCTAGGLCISLALVWGLLRFKKVDIGVGNTGVPVVLGETTMHDPKVVLREWQNQTLEERIDSFFREDLYYGWYEQHPTNWQEYYQDHINAMLTGKEPIADSSAELLVGDEKDAYWSTYNKITIMENKKIPDGYTLEEVRSGLVKPLSLDVDFYKKEYDLRWKNYGYCPMAAMLQQAARSAIDAQMGMLYYKNNYMWDEIIEYSAYGIQGYLDLTLYQAADESKADCCYWIAKAFYGLAVNLPKEYQEFAEHCFRMAWAFAKVGSGIAQTEKGHVDHGNDLQVILQKAEKAIM